MNRGLTTEEAERGVRPAIQTKDEWNAMWLGSMEAERDARSRHTNVYWQLKGVSEPCEDCGGDFDGIHCTRCDVEPYASLREHCDIEDVLEET